MYEKILVPLDGSKRAEMIRPHVRELAGRFKATVVLIMVIEHIYADGIGETYINRRQYLYPGIWMQFLQGTIRYLSIWR